MNECWWFGKQQGQQVQIGIVEDGSHQEAIISPGAKFHAARLYIKREILDINVT